VNRPVVAATILGGGEVLKVEIENEAPRFGLSDSMWRAIRSIKPVDETPVISTEARRPTSIYLRDDRFEAEMENIFRRVAVPIMMSSRLPEVGSSIAHDGYGVPLLLTRDSQGVARAFINGCRHRGSKLVDGCASVKGNRLVCPYHSWTYKLDGTLMGIARADVFPSLDKKNLPLISLTCFEKGGMIWAGLDPRHEARVLEGTDEICADLDAPGFKRSHIYGFKTWDLPANWKLVTEAFLEGYHAPRLHAASVGPQFVDAATIFDHFGPSSRQMSGRKVFEPSILDSSVNIHRYVTASYILFPNMSIITSPYYTSYMIFMPRAKNRTVVEYYMMTDGPPDSEKAEDIYKRSYDLILDVFGNEDFNAAVKCQEAISSGAIPEVYFGGLEPLVGPFHDDLESFLDPSVI
jgi:phenylpropionate dioxygenase-like ring-hydroxylating dioxygenase large terminal subunit